MKKLYEFFWDCGRMGDVEGLFVADEDDVKNAIGSKIYFGEILGKHSEVSGTLDIAEITVVSEDQDKIEWLVGLLGNTVAGYNPLEHIQQYYDEEDE